LFGKNIPERRKMLVGGDGGRELRIENGELRNAGRLPAVRRKGGEKIRRQKIRN
jgi:hypothetical protein